MPRRFELYVAYFLSGWMLCVEYFCGCFFFFVLNFSYFYFIFSFFCF